MQRNHVLLAFATAWVTALGLSWWVYRRASAPQERAVTRVVASARKLAAGQKLAVADLKLIALEQSDVPDGAFFKVEDVAERALVSPVSAGEPILAAKLAAPGGGDGLTAMIEPGMRAIGVQVNDVSSVGGFIQPGTRVDVLFTRAFTNGDSATKTLLQNIKVIAYGKQISPTVPSSEPAASAASTRDNRGPTVATLLVTQEQAERITLAMQRGKIQLALRNPLDAEIHPDFEPTTAEDLGIREPARPGARGGAQDAVSQSGNRPGARRPAPGEVVIKVFRGSTLTEETFLTESARPAAK